MSAAWASVRECHPAVESTSSIEHFGGHFAALRASGEIWRVLKPGGIAGISTEYRLEGPPKSLPGTMLFDARTLDELNVRPPCLGASRAA